MRENINRAFAHFFDAQPTADAPYALRGVEREIPVDQETYARFSAAEDVLEQYQSPEPDYTATVSGETLTGVLEQSEGAVDAIVLDKDDVTDRQLRDPPEAAAELADANDRLFDDHAPQGGVDPYRYDPFLLVDDHEDYLSYTAIVVGAENHLGCKDRKLVFPSGILAYSGTVDAPEDTDVAAFIETTDADQLGGTRYSKYETTMDRLADDVEHAQDMVAAAQEYEMLHPDCDTGTIYVDTPEELRAQRAADIVDAVTALGETAAGFSADTVKMKLANNSVLLTEMLETDADEIADRADQPPHDRYLSDNPDTPLRYALPGQNDGEPRGMPLAQPAHQPYRELAEEVAEILAAGHDPSPVIDVWALNREPADSTAAEPAHVGRMYQ